MKKKINDRYLWDYQLLIINNYLYKKIFKKNLNKLQMLQYFKNIKNSEKTCKKAKNKRHNKKSCQRHNFWF